MEYFLIYLMLQLDSILDVLSGITLTLLMVVAVVTSFAGVVSFFEEENYFKKIPSKCWKWWLVIFLPAIILKTILPTSANMAIIVGGGEVYQAITSETGKRIGGKATLLLEKKMNELLEQKVDVQDKKESK